MKNIKHKRIGVLYQSWVFFLARISIDTDFRANFNRHNVTLVQERFLAEID